MECRCKTPYGIYTRRSHQIILFKRIENNIFLRTCRICTNLSFLLRFPRLDITGEHSYYDIYQNERLVG